MKSIHIVAVTPKIYEFNVFQDMIVIVCFHIHFVNWDARTISLNLIQIEIKKIT